MVMWMQAGSKGWGMALCVSISGCSVLQPFMVTRARLGDGYRVATVQWGYTEFSGPPRSCSPLETQGNGVGLGVRQDQAWLRGLCWVGLVLSKGSAAAVEL